MIDCDDYYMLKCKKFKTDTCVTFDFDGTLAVKKNGDRPYTPENIGDNFVFLYGVVKKLKKLINRGILPIIISNQSDFTTEKDEIFTAVYDFFDKKITIFVAHLKNEFRKPKIGFYELISKKYNILYHCGDAIGNSDFHPYNFSSADRKFAKKAGIDFKDPRDVFGSNFETIVPEEKIVIMMGLPGSGKTTISKRLERKEGFVRFSQDELKDLKLKRNIRAMKNVLDEDGKIVLDATHRKKELILPFINLAKEYELSYVILWCVRDGRVFNDLRKKPVNHFPFSLYVKEFEEPEENFIIVS